MRDLSINRVQELRSAFERNLDFYHEIGVLYNHVKKLAEAHHSGFAAEMRKLPTAHLAVTSNHRFYGALNQEVMKAFLNDWDKVDRHAVIGATGRLFMENDPRAQACDFKEFEDDNPTRWEIQKVVSWIKGYSTVIVYYPKYRNPFLQEPTTINITHAPEGRTAADHDVERYIFEPDLPLIHDFFTTQVQYILIQRVMLETDLSRTATRLVRMDSAEDRSSELYRDKQRQLRKDIQKQLDLQLFESIAGLERWRT